MSSSTIGLHAAIVAQDGALASWALGRWVT